MTHERRTYEDRRARPTPILSRYTVLGGQRYGPRREEEASSVYADRIGQGIGVLLLLTFFFHCLDAMFTLAHLAKGGRELNPLMDFFIQRGSMEFVVVKLTMAGVGLIFLGLHNNFPMVKGAIRFLFALYGLVVGYHLFLIMGA